MSKKQQPNLNQTQAECFIEAAREAGCSEDEAEFDEMMRKLTKAKPPPKDSKPEE